MDLHRFNLAAADVLCPRLLSLMSRSPPYVASHAGHSVT